MVSLNKNPNRVSLLPMYLSSVMPSFCRALLMLSSTIAVVPAVVFLAALQAKADDAKIGHSSAEKTTQRRTATFSDSGGFYSSGSDGNIGTLNIFRASVDGEINDRLRKAKKAGLINVVQLNEGSRFRGDLKKAKESLDGWLRRTDLSLVDAVYLCEEHPTSAQANLDALYDRVKAFDAALPLYVWPSYPLGPFGKADGWVYDAYGADYTDFRRIVFDYLQTGKPFIACIDGSGYSDIRSAREQLMVCRELDVPVFYFVADSGSGSVNGWKSLQRAALIPWRHFVYTGIEFQKRCIPGMMSAADMLWGDTIELAADSNGKIKQEWRGLGPATVFGFTRLDIDGDKICPENGQRVSLDLPFWSVLPVEKAELTLLVDRDPGVNLVVKRSRCGQPDDWKTLEGKYADGKITYPLGENLGHEFRVRIEFASKNSDRKTPLAIRGYSIEGLIDVPLDRAIDLDFFYDAWRGRVDFRQDMAAGLWRTVGRIDNPDALEQSAAPALRGRAGSGVDVTVVEKLTSRKPLENIVVRLAGFENRSNLGGSFTLGVSLDGKTILKRISPDPEEKNAAQTSPDGSYNGPIALDLGNVPEFDGCQSFYVHLRQNSGSGVRGNISSRIERLEVDAGSKKR